MIRAILAVLVAAVLGGVTARAAEIKVISSNGMADIIVDTKAQFESETHHKLTVNVVPTGEVTRRVLAGEAFDVIITPRNALGELEDQGRMVRGTAVALIRVNFGLAVATDGPRPDVSTPEALKRTLLAAKTVVITDPSTGGISGVHFMEVLNKLGIAAEMKDKIVPRLGNDFHAQQVVQGTADLAVQSEHEIRCVKGATFLDYPAVFQRSIVFMGGLGKTTHDSAPAKSYLSFLASAQVANSYRAHCLKQSAG